MKSKAPNLEGLLQTPGEIGARMKTKHFLAMRKDTIAHECVDSVVCGLSPRGASEPWLNRQTLKMEKCK